MPMAQAAYPTPQPGRVLMAKRFDPLDYLVGEVLHEGLTILAGKPKKGKSYMALDMSLAMAVGRLAFRHFPTKQQQVLYVSLEDGERTVANTTTQDSTEPDASWRSRLSSMPSRSWRLVHSKP